MHFGNVGNEEPFSYSFLLESWVKAMYLYELAKTVNICWEMAIVCKLSMTVQKTNSPESISSVAILP